MYYIILIAFAILMIWISEKSSMLRNSIFNAENFAALAKTEKIKKPKASYSLGRSQLAFWTVIVASSFIYLLLSQSAYPQIVVPVLDTVNLTLISIAAGTTVISKVIDSSQKENQNGSVPQQDYPSEGFFIDIVSDEKGVSIHRLQNVIWTVIVGGIYIAYVSGHTTLPDDTILTNNLLGLMGISTAAYLGLKLNENKGIDKNINTTPVQTFQQPVQQPPQPGTTVMPSISQPLASDTIETVNNNETLAANSTT